MKFCSFWIVNVKKFTVQNVLSWKDACFSQLKQKTAQCIQKLPHPLSVFPDLSQEHYYGIAVSSRKSIVGIEMQMSKPNSPSRCRGSLSPSAPHFWTGGGLTWARFCSQERSPCTHNPRLCTQNPWLALRPGSWALFICKTHHLGADGLYQQHEGMEGFPNPPHCRYFFCVLTTKYHHLFWVKSQRLYPLQDSTSCSPS